MNRIMEAVKDLQIKQLTEYFMTAGNPFLNRDEHSDDNISGITSETNIDEENVNNTRSCGETGSQLYK